MSGETVSEKSIDWMVFLKMGAVLAVMSSVIATIPLYKVVLYMVGGILAMAVLQIMAAAAGAKYRPSMIFLFMDISAVIENIALCAEKVWVILSNAASGFKEDMFVLLAPYFSLIEKMEKIGRGSSILIVFTLPVFVFLFCAIIIAKQGQIEFSGYTWFYIIVYIMLIFIFSFISICICNDPREKVSHAYIFCYIAIIVFMIIGTTLNISERNRK